jgi:lauroyl/myristoyl acyltransferase
VNLVIAREPNPTVQGFIHDMRTRHGFNVLYSDRSVLGGLPMLTALRRGEVVCMQLDPWGALRGTHEVTFCGRPARFQLGPFALARLARAPLVPAFMVRCGTRRYEVRFPERFDPRTHAESAAALEAVTRTYEALVRDRPEQWLMFEDVWEANGAAEPDYEMVPQASGLRRR